MTENLASVWDESSAAGRISDCPWLAVARLTHNLRLLWVCLLAVSFVALPSQAVGAESRIADSLGPQVEADDWLGRLNQVRSESGLMPLTERSEWSTGIDAHLAYLSNTPPDYLVGSFANLHRQNPASPFYSAEGAEAGASSNLIFGGSGTPVDDVNWWLTAPFHALHMLSPDLQEVGYSSDGEFSGLRVFGGPRNPASSGEAVLFPGNGAPVTLTEFRGESPSPLESCPGLTNPSLPLVVQFTEAPGPDLSATLYRPDGTQQKMCVITNHTYFSSDAAYGSSGLSILTSHNAAVFIASGPLTDGEHSVEMQNAPETPSWSFDVFERPDHIQDLDVNLTPNEIVVTWSPPNEQRLPILSFEVELAGAGEIRRCQTTSLVCRFDGLPPSTPYGVSVVAINAAGASQSYGLGSTSPPAVPPTPPRSITTIPSIDGIRVEWSAAIDPYDFELTYSVALTSVVVCVTQSLSCDLSGLRPDTSYNLTLIASNALVGADPVVRTARTASCIGHRFYRENDSRIGETFDDLAASPCLHRGHSTILRLYWAVFARKPDVDGSRFWIDSFNSGNWSTRRVAEHFSVSPEFVELYGATTSNEEFAALMYRNVLGREPDRQGFGFWVGQLEAGMTRYEMILLISNDAEFVGRHPLPGDHFADLGPLG